MDATDYVSILQLYSKHLRTLAAQLETQLLQLDQLLQEQKMMRSAEARTQMDRLREGSARVVHTAELFQRCLLAFHKTSQGDKDPSP